MIMARIISVPDGSTAEGKDVVAAVRLDGSKSAPAWNSVAMTNTNTPMASARPKKISARNSTFARAPMTPSATLPMDWPFARMETTSAEKSCTQPTKTAPKTTHSMAGTQPQMTATAGPSIGANPVIEA